MLDNIIELEDDVLVFFYDEEDGDVDDIMTAMESIGKPNNQFMISTQEGNYQNQVILYCFPTLVVPPGRIIESP